MHTFVFISCLNVFFRFNFIPITTAHGLCKYDVYVNGIMPRKVHSNHMTAHTLCKYDLHVNGIMPRKLGTQSIR